MLYATTRNNQDAYTAQRALRENRGPDGGLYVPFRLPEFSREAFSRLAEKSFNQRIAEVLNLLFQTKLTGWDVDFCVGRHPVRLETLGHRMVVAEAWHNPGEMFARMADNLAAHLTGEMEPAGDWLKIAVRTAVLAAVLGELAGAGVEEADISVVSEDFSAPISAWYARQWGLPVGNIVCCCNENNQLWELMCHGQMRTDAVSVPTATPLADVALPEDLERLICGCGGQKEVEAYLEACRKGGIYCPPEGLTEQLRSGIYVSVVSSPRLEMTIPRVYRTHGYLMGPYTALAYAGLQDYRAKTGQTRWAVILAERSPACDTEAVARGMGISLEELRNNL